MLMAVLNHPGHYSVLLSGENQLTSRVGMGLYSREKWLALFESKQSSIRRQVRSPLSTCYMTEDTKPTGPYW